MAALVAVAVVVAGCSSGSGKTSVPTIPTVPAVTSSTPAGTAGSPSPTSVPTTGPLVSSGEKPPVLPALARQHNATGANVFARYYWQAYDWSLATMSTVLMTPLAASRCKECSREIREIDTLAAKGGFVASGRITVLRATLVTGEFTVKSDYVIETRTSQEVVVVRYPSAAPKTDSPATTDVGEYVFVSWRAGGWQVVALGAVA